MLDLTVELLKLNRLEYGQYAEPFAGGCGLALALLYGGHVSEIHINDIDVPIWCFWNSVLNDTDRLVDKIESVPVTIEEWRLQKEVHSLSNIKKPLELGFATFFLNRTNRSGIIKGAGVIGGYRQLGKYKLDCRYNKPDLIRRIRRVAKYREQIHLYNCDALKFLNLMRPILSACSLMFIDPPYFNKGADLYTSFYKPEDHAKLAGTIGQIKTSWIVTYDEAPEIKRLYGRQRQSLYSLGYSVQTKRIGTELLIARKNLKLPDSIRSRPAITEISTSISC